MVRTTATINAQVKRRPESWNYIYVFLGFTLAIEGDVIQMLQMDRTWSLVPYAALASATVYLFLNNGWFQNKLTGMKSLYEEKWR